MRKKDTCSCLKSSKSGWAVKNSLLKIQILGNLFTFFKLRLEPRSCCYAACQQQNNNNEKSVKQRSDFKKSKEDGNPSKSLQSFRLNRNSRRKIKLRSVSVIFIMFSRHLKWILTAQRRRQQKIPNEIIQAKGENAFDFQSKWTAAIAQLLQIFWPNWFLSQL